MSTSVKALTQVDGETVEAIVDYKFGDTFDESVEKIGEFVVYNGFKKSAVIDFQRLIRRAIKGGLSQEAIEKVAEDWVPGQRSGSFVNKKEAVIKMFAAMSADGRGEFIEKIRALK